MAYTIKEFDNGWVVASASGRYKGQPITKSFPSRKQAEQKLAGMLKEDQDAKRGIGLSSGTADFLGET